MTHAIETLETALTGLLEKYGVEVPRRWTLSRGPRRDALAGGITTLVAAWEVPAGPCDAGVVPLLLWRFQRRYMELKQLVESRTIASVVMVRSACLADSSRFSVEALLYRELDLLEWLTDQEIKRIYATGGRRTMNVIARLADSSIASIEVAATLPPDAQMEDRHELIARRGIASDRAVDTQVRQDSIYLWHEGGRTAVTDVDHELFGLDDEEVALVRAAIDALRTPEANDRLRRRHEHLTALVSAASRSEAERRPVAPKGTAPT